MSEQASANLMADATSERRAFRPNIFVVGGSKCGTTSLYRMLQMAEGIGTSRTRKELHFFSAPEILARLAAPGDEGMRYRIVADEASYLDEFSHLMENTTNVVDVSPSYLQNPEAAARIKAFAPNARIVILLRDPIAKMFSQYVHLWSAGLETLPFPEAFARSAERRAAGYSPMWDYERGGYYADAVARYFNFFGRDNVHVEVFEDLFGPNPAATEQLARFLGIRFAEGPPPKVNVSGRSKSPVWNAVLGNNALRRGVRKLLPLPLRDRFGSAIRGRLEIEKPRIDAETAVMLRTCYASDVVQLEALLGCETGWARA